MQRLSGPRTPAQRAGRVLLGGFVLLACLFLVAPIAVIVPLSFSSSSFLSYPLPGLTLEWYAKVLQPFPWMNALWNSVTIAAGATLLATVLGTLAAYGLTMTRFPGRGLILGLVVSPLIVPMIIIALGVYFLYARVGLYGTFTGLILAHTVLGVPYVVITVMASLKAFDTRLVRAAESLGGSPLTTFRTVTLPMIAPGVASGALFAFVTSFDEIVVALFIAAPAQFTLPRQLFGGLRDQLDPSIIAISTLIIVFTLLLLGLFELLRRRTARFLGES